MDYLLPHCRLSEVWTISYLTAGYLRYGLSLTSLQALIWFQVSLFIPKPMLFLPAFQIPMDAWREEHTSARWQSLALSRGAQRMPCTGENTHGEKQRDDNKILSLVPAGSREHVGFAIRG